jgi:hypothetical protein
MNGVKYVDGWVGRERPLSVVPEPEFSFKNNPTPDTYSRLYTRQYEEFARPFISKMGIRLPWTNIILQSEDFATSWTAANVSLTAGAATAPNGDATMTAVMETTANGQHSLSQAANATAAPWEFSVFAKGGLTQQYVRLSFIDSAAVTHHAYFNIVGGFLGGKSTGVSSKIVNLGNGDFRLVMQVTPAAGAGSFKINISADGAAISYIGNTANGVYLWGAQVNLGRESPYVSTTTVARTISAPLRDPEDPFAFLINEDKAKIENSELAKVVRTYARIPRQQIVPDSQWVKKPEIPGEFPQVLGNSIIVKPEENVPRWIFYTKTDVTADSGPPSSGLTGGTFTITFGANTTAGLAYNITATALQTALNGLASVTAAGGVTVSGSASGGFTVTFGAWATSTVNTASIVAANQSISSTVAVSAGGKVQNVLIKPEWSAAHASAASSFTPPAANPISWLTAGSPTPSGIQFFLGNLSIYGAPATGGTYTITLWGETTGPIAFNADNATIKAAIDALTVPASMGGYTVHDITIQGASPSKNAVPTNLPAITGGTFTLTVLGQTTAAIAYNASLADIQTAINALSNVTARGGVIVSGTGFASGQISFVITFANVPAMTGNPASLVPSGSSMFVTATSSEGRTQTISFSVLPTTVRILSAGGHGITAADPILVKLGTNYYELAVGVFTVPDGNTIGLLASSGLLSRAGVVTVVGKQTGTVYTADSKYTRVERVTDSYLLGVTPGVNTLSDIPLPVYQGDPASLLTAIFNGTTNINIEVGGITLYRDGPIVQRIRTTVNPTTL